MNISYKKIEGKDNKPVKYKSNKYPQFTDPDLPRNYFCMLSVGARGSGKTMSVIKLLKMQEKTQLLEHAYAESEGHPVSQRIILFCPTIEGNRIYNSLRYLAEEDIYTEYDDSMLEAVLKDIKYEKEQTEKYAVIKHALIKFHRAKNPNLELEPEELILLMEYNFELPSPPKFPNGCITSLIFDDLVGTDAFKSVGRSRLTNTVLNGRHLSVNIYILSQNLMAIPKSIRVNSTVLAIFRYGQRKVLENLYDEVSNLMSFDTFEKIYYETTEDSFSFLLIDHTQPKEFRLKKNYEYVISYK